MALSAWQRLGIVVTATWVIGATLAMAWLEVQDAHAYLANVGDLCAEIARVQVDCLGIVDRARRNFASIPFDWAPVLFVALAPVPVFWIVAWTSLAVGRWVRRGFRSGSMSSGPQM